MSELVSVIIPAFNSAPYLEEAIESALNQNYHPLEIILVDNNSTDSTWSICKSYKDRYPAIFTILQEPEQGASAARNAALALARGKWIQFLDADDYLYRGKLKRQIPLAEEHQPVFIAGAADCHSLSGPTQTIVPEQDPWKGIAFSRIGCIHSNLFYRQALIKAGGFDETLPYTVDQELYLRLLQRNDNVLVDPVPGGLYRDRKGFRLTRFDPPGFQAALVRHRFRVLAFLRQNRPEYFAANRDYFYKSLIQPLRMLATHDLEKAKQLYSKMIPGEYRWKADPLFFIPFWLPALYSSIGFYRTEKLRIAISRSLPRALVQRLKQFLSQHSAKTSRE